MFNWKRLFTNFGWAMSMTDPMCYSYYLASRLASADGKGTPDVASSRMALRSLHGRDRAQPAVLQMGPQTPAIAHLDIDKQGYAWLPEEDFINHFAGDVDPIQAKVMFAVQQPLAASALGEAMGEPAWKSIASWYLVAQADQAIPPDAERLFAKRMGATVVEVDSNHLPMVSHPDEVVKLIKAAVETIARTESLTSISR